MNTESYFDGREMLMIHTTFRREFGLMPELVLGAAPGDEERAALVSDHIAALSVVLHAHHEGEDVFVWPWLLERCDEKVQPFVDMMAAQHTEIEKTLAEVETTLTAWREEPSAQHRDVLAEALRSLNTALVGHMAAEEEHIVPLMEKYITLAEGNQLAGHGAAEIGQETLVLALGMAMYEADPEVVEMVVKNMPPELQPVIVPLAKGAFAKHSEVIHGTATPTRSSEI
jgi:Hemerythrin HHE cation binding domain